MRFLKYVAVFLLGFLIARFWYKKEVKIHKQEEIKVVVNSINNLSKLVVSEGTFSEIYNYTDSKKYFYDYLSFDKKAIISVNAKVEVGYDLSKMDIQIDSIAKKILINKIPSEEINVSPDIKYFDLQQSSFNAFTKTELNKINQKSIDKIKETAKVFSLKTDAKNRLFTELSKIYQLSSVYGWQVVDNTNANLLDGFQKIKD